MGSAGHAPVSRRILSAALAFLLAVSLGPAGTPVESALARSMSPTPHSSGAGSSPYDVTIGDLNDDGLNDVAVANFKAGTVGVYYQDGAGNLGPMQALTVPPAPYRGGYPGNPYSVKITDFDQDGLNDLVATNEFHHQVWLYRQDSVNELYLWQMGSGLTDTGAHPYSNPYGVDVGDLNMDSDPDIAVANYQKGIGNVDSGSVGVFGNISADLLAVDFVTPEIGFTSGWHGAYRTFTGGVNPDYSAAVTSLWESLYVPVDDAGDADVNFNDIEYAGQDNLWAVGDYGYVAMSESLGASWRIVKTPSERAGLGGVSSSGVSNIVVVGNGGLFMRTEDGGINWSEDSTKTITNDLHEAVNFGSTAWVVGSGGLIALWDYSGDDLVVTEAASGTASDLYDLEMQGSNGWAVGADGTVLNTTNTVSWTPQTSGTAETLTATSFDDTSTGWAVGTGGTIIATGDGGATWTPQASGTSQNLNDVDFTDANNGRAVGDNGTVLVTSDGGATWVDASIGNQTPGVHVLPPMQNFDMTPTAKNPYALKITDANSDGKSDISVAAWTTSNITNFRLGWDGEGLIWDNDSKQEVASGKNPAALTSIDYNGDGRDDVAAANYDSGDVSILTQPVLPTNGFDAAATLAAGQRPLGIAAGDVNGDGLQDLAVSNADSNSISVFTKETTTGPYNEAANFSTSSANGGQPYGVAVGDVDDDGVDEVVVANSSPANGNGIDVFKVTQRPGAPGVTSSTHPDSSVYYLSNKPQFRITPPADVDGVSGFYWSIDQSPLTVPTPATGTWSASGVVNILSGLTPDGEYYLHAVAKDEKGNIGSSSSEAAHYLFKINSTPLIATIQSPGDGATVGGTINVDATATTSSLFTVSQVEVYLDDAASPEAVLTSAPYRYVWDTSGVADGEHAIKIVVTDTGNRQSTDINTVTVDNSAPGGGGGGSGSGVTRSSMVLDGSQFQSPAAGVIGMDFYDQANDAWSSVGYYAANSAAANGIYEFDLPSPSGYLWQKVTINEDATKAQGEAARYYAYNWSTDAWDRISATQELPFWYVDHGTNQVKIRVQAPSWSVHQIDSIGLEYKYMSDSAAPIVSGLQAGKVNFASDYYSRISFGLSENAYVTATIKNASATTVRTIETAKSGGLPTIYWDLRDDSGVAVRPGAYTVTVQATDLADNSVTTAPAAITQVLAGSTTWYFADGATSSSRDTYVVLYNAGPRNTRAYVDYILSTGRHSLKSYSVSAKSFTRVKVNSAIGNGRTFGMKITSDDPIVAERPSYFNSSGRLGGHTTIGSTTTSEDWYFADGSTKSGHEEDLALLNPTATNAAVKVTYMYPNGTSTQQTFTLGKNRRTTLNVERYTGLGKDVSVHVETTNGVGIVAERADYFSYRGWTDGSISLGAKAPGDTWYFAAGNTGTEADEYLVLQNPGASTAGVTVKYMLESGAAITKLHNVGAGRRLSLKVNSYVGINKNVGMQITSTQPIVAERTQYMKKGAITGGYSNVGATEAGNTWYFADGDTASSGSEQVSILNPSSSTTANVLLKFRQRNRTLSTRSVRVGANSVAVFDAATTVGTGKLVSLEVVSDQPVVVERPMTFKHSGWDGGSNAAGYLVQ